VVDERCGEVVVASVPAAAEVAPSTVMTAFAVRRPPCNCPDVMIGSEMGRVAMFTPTEVVVVVTTNASRPVD
jgi:hypothetical protein